MGRALPLKRLDVLIAAFERLQDVACRLTVVGDGPALPGLREQAAALPNVRFEGAVPSDRVVDAYNEADVFIFPSRDDVFGLVLVEGMGAGLATIVSSRPGSVADLVAPGRSGLVIDGYDPADWADAIRSLVEDPARRDALGRAARETILGRWTLDHSVDAIAAGLRLGVLAARTVIAGASLRFQAPCLELLGRHREEDPAHERDPRHLEPVLEERQLRQDEERDRGGAQQRGQRIARASPSAWRCGSCEARRRTRRDRPRRSRGSRRCPPRRAARDSSSTGC